MLILRCQVAVNKRCHRHPSVLRCTEQPSGVNGPVWNRRKVFCVNSEQRNSGSPPEPRKSDGGQPGLRQIGRRLERKKSITEKVSFLLNTATANTVDFIRTTKQAESQATGAQNDPQQVFNQFIGKLRYNYYNWRKDNFSDLQLFLCINVGLVLLGGLLKSEFVDSLLDCGTLCDDKPHWWLDIYEVGVWVFGDGFPEPEEDGVSQLFALTVATVGLAGFALSLALVQQVVLDVIKTNVRQGSPIYEAGHIVVLAWGGSQADIEILERMLTQLAVAYEADGGCTTVIMTMRDKIDLEEYFNKQIPESKRYGSMFVFREGSPLKLEDLKRVAVSRAAAVLVVSDSHLDAVAADAQALRVAVLIDELDAPQMKGNKDMRKGHVVIELMDPNSLDLLEYSTSRRVIGLPTTLINARRIAYSVRHPVATQLSRQIWDFNSSAQLFLEYLPHLENKRFGDLAYYFPDGTVVGLMNNYTSSLILSPPDDYRVRCGDYLLMCRPARGYKLLEYKPLDEPLPNSPDTWKAADYQAKLARVDHEIAVSISNDSLNRMNSFFANSDQDDLYLIPREYLSSYDEQTAVLVCGWGDPVFMKHLLMELDSGPAALQAGSTITLFNPHDKEVVMGLCDTINLRNVGVMHVNGNPLKDSEVKSKVDVTVYRCAIVLCDLQWRETDDIERITGYESIQLTRRIDACMMMVQLNIRRQLETMNYPDINIMCEKFTVDNVVTRFEDPVRLPVGNCLNSNSFSAKMLVQAAVLPKALLPMFAFGARHTLLVQDSSAFVREGEAIDYWQLMARVRSVDQLLLGYYIVPHTIDAPVDVIVNPVGQAMRSQRRVWNMGDGRTKLVTVVEKERAAEPSERKSKAAIRMMNNALDFPRDMASSSSSSRNGTSSSSSPLLDTMQE